VQFLVAIETRKEKRYKVASSLVSPDFLQASVAIVLLIVVIGGLLVAGAIRRGSK
jgi:hypothetical protein